MIGRSLHARQLADLLHRVDAVHLRHHDVHQHDVDARVASARCWIASRPLSAETIIHAVLVQHRGQREDVAHVVVDDQHLLALEHALRAVQVLERLALVLRHRGRAAVQEEVDAGRAAARAMRASRSAKAPSPRCQRVVGRLAVAVQTRPAAARRPACSLERVEHVAAARGRATARRPPGSRRCRSAQQRRGARAVARRRQLRRRRRPGARRARSRAALVRHRRPAAPARRRATKSLQAASSASSTSVARSGAAWRRSRARPSSSARSRASSVETTHTGMWRVARSFFSRSSTRQPSMSGRKMSSVIAAGLVLARSWPAPPRRCA